MCGSLSALAQGEFLLMSRSSIDLAGGLELEPGWKGADDCRGHPLFVV